MESECNHSENSVNNYNTIAEEPCTTIENDRRIGWTQGGFVYITLNAKLTKKPPAGA